MDSNGAPDQQKYLVLYYEVQFFNLRLIKIQLGENFLYLFPDDIK